ncbi:MAG: dihydroorotate dehydrogenase electron transfer subunit [Tissierellia bacterium]|nr:dihydroorotate dehydrogenase electron transfer subunit [Tissierellia bacterium]
MEYKDAYIDTEILSNEKIGEGVYKMTVSGKFCGEPGQFFMLREENSAQFLPRPFSICDINENSISFLYLVMGCGTKAYSKLRRGDHISVLGPLGNGFKLKDYDKVAIISGGIGIAPMYYLAKKLNCKIDLYAGFRDYSYFIDELRPFVNEIKISSDLGLEGTKGTVLAIYEDKKYDQIFACGPTPMLKAIKTKIDLNKAQLSLENHMACGTGACLGCVTKTTAGLKRVCTEGPVFMSNEVLNDA